MCGRIHFFLLEIMIHVHVISDSFFKYDNKVNILSDTCCTAQECG